MNLLTKAFHLQHTQDRDCSHLRANLPEHTLRSLHFGCPNIRTLLPQGLPRLCEEVAMGTTDGRCLQPRSGSVTSNLNPRNRGVARLKLTDTGRPREPFIQGLCRVIIAMLCTFFGVLILGYRFHDYNLERYPTDEHFSRTNDMICFLHPLLGLLQQSS